MDMPDLIKINTKMQTQAITDMNARTENYGLVLSADDIHVLMSVKQETLKEERRIEFSESVIPKIIDTFCDSPFISQSNYLQTLIDLQRIFFEYKNEMDGEITDDELLHFMKEQFDGVCYGDTGYLETTCLDAFARAVRAGYAGLPATDGFGEYENLDPVPRWDHSLYLEALNELVQ